MPSARASASPIVRPVSTRSLAAATPINGPSRAGPTGTPSRAPAQANRVVAADAQVGAGDDLGAGADAVADRHGDDRHGELVEPAVQPGERGHPRDAGGVVELLADVGPGAQRGHLRGRDDERPQARRRRRDPSALGRAARAIAVSSALRLSGRFSRRIAIGPRRSTSTGSVIRSVDHTGWALAVAVTRSTGADVGGFRAAGHRARRRVVPARRIRAAVRRADRTTTARRAAVGAARATHAVVGRHQHSPAARRAARLPIRRDRQAARPSRRRTRSPRRRDRPPARRPRRDAGTPDRAAHGRVAGDASAPHPYPHRADASPADAAGDTSDDDTADGR